MESPAQTQATSQSASELACVFAGVTHHAKVTMRGNRLLFLLISLATTSCAWADGPRWTMKDGLTMAPYPEAIDAQKHRRAARPHPHWTSSSPGGRPAPPVELHRDRTGHDGRQARIERARKSPRDGKQGLVFGFESPKFRPHRIRITIRTEKFQNGAHPYVVAELTADHPNEVNSRSSPNRTAQRSSSASSPRRWATCSGCGDCIWRIESPPNAELFAKDPGEAFTPQARFELTELKHDADGVIVDAEATKPIRAAQRPCQIGCTSGRMTA